MTTVFRIQPAWAANADRQIDITDNLYDVDKEARDYGHVCTAFFDEADGMAAWQGADYAVKCLRLIGISIDRGMGRVSWYDAKDAALILGDDAVERIETVQAEGLA